ncbi:hypothetical protein J6590_023564 [Homalodisca vitripennis]|nr:hypothetical protein J6590_023564 [Homalodisca vitripennis]
MLVLQVEGDDVDFPSAHTFYSVFNMCDVRLHYAIVCVVPLLSGAGLSPEVGVLSRRDISCCILNRVRQSGQGNASLSRFPHFMKEPYTSGYSHGSLIERSRVQIPRGPIMRGIIATMTPKQASKPRTEA